MLRRDIVGLLGIVAAGLLAGAPATSAAQAYPSHEIRFIVPWNPGGAADIHARLLAKLLAPKGFNFIVENVAGATGSIGLAKVAGARPDGYTIGLATSSQLALVAQGLTKTKNSEFTCLNQTTTDNYLLVVPISGPANLKAFLATVKSNPDKLSVGTAGGNNVPHIFTAATSVAAGGGLIHVPYPGASKAITDLAGGQISAGILKPSESKGQIDSGLLRAIAVYADARIPSLPNVPTFKESGLDVFPWGHISNISWLVAPAGLPPAIRTRLIDAFAEALKSDEYAKYAAENGFTAPTLSGDALMKEVDKAQATFDAVAPRVFKKE